MNDKLQRLRKKRNALLQKIAQRKKRIALPEDPIELVGKLFCFRPYEYQARLLSEEKKRIAVRWSRQAGKTTCIALRAITHAITHPNTLTLIVAPSLRQSMITRDRVQDFLMSMPREY